MSFESPTSSVVDEAKKRYARGKDFWAETWRNFDTNLDFYVGEQWDERQVRDRGSHRPAISINLCRPKVAQVVNNFRANRPGPKVSPINNVDDPAMAEVHEGLLRHTDYVSNAEVAYDTCFEYAAGGSIGVYGLTFDYATPDSFDMQVSVRRFPDPKAVMFDPASQDANGADSQWVIVRQKLSKSEYERKYGKSRLSQENYFVTDDYARDWVSEDTVWIAEYWTIEYKKRTLVDIGDGQGVWADDPRLMQAAPVDAETGEQDLSQFKTREVDYPCVYQRIINGVEVLDETEFPATRIPIWFVCGNDVYVRGERKISGLLDDARTPQMMLNYAESLNIEAMAMAPKPKWIGAEGQFLGHEDEFAAANVSNKTYLEYKPVQMGGQFAPPPQFVVFEPKSGVMDVAASRAGEYIKATTGLYDSSLGNIDPRAHSGKAIQALQQSGATASSHITDNFNRSLKWRYQTEIEINTRIMTPGKMVRILGPDQKSNIQVLGNAFFDGRFDVAISTGPSYQSQRDAVKDFVGGLMQSNPQEFALVADIAIKLADLGPLGDQMAKRLTPPQFAQNENLPPQVAQQLQQGQQQLQALQQELQQAKQVIATDQIKRESALELEQMKFQHAMAMQDRSDEVKLLIARAKEQADAAIADVKQQMEYLKTQVAAAHEARMAQDQRHHEASLKAADHAVSHQMAIEGRQHAEKMAAQQPQQSNDSAAQS